MNIDEYFRLATLAKLKKPKPGLSVACSVVGCKRRISISRADTYRTYENGKRVVRTTVVSAFCSKHSPARVQAGAR